jgi:hypothetical protein
LKLRLTACATVSKSDLQSSFTPLQVLLRSESHRPSLPG